MSDLTLPVVGAAMPSEHLAKYADWLKESQRDLEIQDPAKPNTLDTDWRATVKTMRSVLDGYTGRLGVHGPFFGFPLFAPDRKVREALASRLDEALDYCAELGATHMVLHSPIENLGTPFDAFASGGWVNPLETIHALLDPAVERAASIGCTLVIETIFDTDPALWMRLVQSFNSPYLRASVDVGHVYVSHKLLNAPPPDYWLRHAGALLGHVHLQDNDGSYDRHWRLGTGSIHFHPIFDAIRRGGGQPRLILEMWNHEDILPSAAWLAEQGLAR